MEPPEGVNPVSTRTAVGSTGQARSTPPTNTAAEPTESAMWRQGGDGYLPTARRPPDEPGALII